MIRFSLYPRHFVAAVSIAAITALSPLAPASAATISGSMLVSATVLASCLTVVPAPLAFGTYDPASGTAVNGTSTIAVTCTPGTVATVTLDAGQNAGSASAFASRAMKFGSVMLPYQIYKDSARSQIWGDGTTGGSQSVSVTGIGSVTAYGQIAPGTSVAAGLYADTVSVTVSF